MVGNQIDAKVLQLVFCNTFKRSLKNLFTVVFRRGFKVYKTVELYNTAVLSASARSPLWTAAKDLHGNEVSFVFLVVSRK